MKITLAQLAEFLDFDADVDTLAERMTAIGAEVEEIDDPARRLKDFTVGEVLQADPHPDADRLKVCRVATKDGEKPIVCGAANARTGIKVAYAAVGTYVPGIDVTLSKAKIRGVESFGMMCSARELELGEDHDGIIELPADAPVGRGVAEILALEPVIDFAVTPNRPDWLGVKGLARDLAAAGLGSLKEDRAPAITPACDASIAVALSFDAETADACPLFAGRVLGGLKNGPSPAWLQESLTAVGLRPISAVVDVTNYISHMRCRPLHAYDLDKVSGGLHARLAQKGESFTALDGARYELSGEECVIADETGVVGLGGVMGGETTGATDATTAIFLEAAYFDPVRTAKTGRAHAIDSEARRRFERGVDPEETLADLDRAAALVLDLCGGEASEVVVAGAPPAGAEPIAFDPARVAALTGVSPGAAEIEKRLNALGFKVDASSAPWSVTAPPWRPDVDGAADLVEEVARLTGYADVTATPLPPISDAREARLKPAMARARLAKRALGELGYDEAVTWSFMRPEWAALFGPAPEALSLQNPIASDLSQMRPSLLPNLIEAVRKSADKGFPGGRLFEVGPIFSGDGPGDQARAAAGVFDPRSPRDWRGGAPRDVFDVKADALALLDAVGAKAAQAQIAQEAPAHFHPGRSGVIRLGPKRPLAFFGEVHPRVLKALDVAFPVFAFEAFLDNIPQAKSKSATRPARDVSDLMPFTRDFAFVLKSDVAADTALRAAKGADKALIADVTVFDLYEGEGVGEGMKSLGLEVTIQPKSETLDDKAIEALSAKIVASVEKATGGTLRA